ncbi:uncharacterized mitochondrial protein AtMg00310-like [Helianthus annuus]|uniref:uncharacterized mitochondrial protein AtMg00310-like n=1 Tax=Helianthus annuus TaxID=4232 RepID=UPI000B8FDCE7|nr:uncharacterized mitochondrial protein AtMg00310-like [Helianthus annuus]
MGALPNYYMSMFLAPKKVIQKLEAIRRNFVWGSKVGKNKICWIAWKTMVRPREYGGFGIGDLRNTNLALLVKWAWKYKTNQEALWAKVVTAIHENKRHHKYIPVNKRFTGIWKDITGSYNELSKKSINLKERLVAKIGDGKKIKLWLDNWAGELPLRDRYPELYKIAKNKQETVAKHGTKVGNETHWNIEWRRPPNNDEEWRQWSGMWNELNKTKIDIAADRWGWKSDKWETFSVAAVKRLIDKQLITEPEEQWNHWNTWAPAKINYFTWRAAIGKIAVKEELKKEV